MNTQPNTFSVSLDEAIERGLEFLRGAQLPSGEFEVLRSREENGVQIEAVADSTPFASAIIAYSLQLARSKGARQSEVPVLEELLRNVTRFLLREREDGSVWRYWTKAHPHHSVIPPDLDDTAYVADVLKRQKIAFPSNEKLLALNRNKDGLFYTWLAPRREVPPLDATFWRVVMRQLLRPFLLYGFWKLNESAPGDIDGVVNANVLFFLGEREETQAVVPFLMNIVRENRETSCDKWHLNRFTFYYAVGRNFGAGVRSLGTIRDEVVRRIESFAKPSGAIGDGLLDTALASCALMLWQSRSPALEGAIRFLLLAQTEDGGWPREVLYYGGPQRYYGWGSRELTSGLCLEALARFRERDVRASP